MIADFYIPKNEILQKYMNGYYFIARKRDSEPTKYLTFPNNWSIHSVKEDSDVEYLNHKLHIKPSAEKKINSRLVFSYNVPLEISYEQLVNEVTVVFKPLGIHYFIPNLNFSQMENGEFWPQENYADFMRSVFAETNREKQRDMIEEYWIAQFADPDLGMICTILNDVESTMKIEEIAHKNQITRRYLNKLFHKYMGKSTSEYRKICRFRKALQEYKKARNLTDLTYINAYHDQSHFIKDFKALTKINPATFFKKVDTEQETIWLFK